MLDTAGNLSLLDDRILFWSYLSSYTSIVRAEIEVYNIYITERIPI